MGLADKFRFSSKQDDTHWYGWNGGLVISPTPIYLDAPDKWRDTEKSWKRSKENGGYTRANAAPYNYVKAFASILRKAYYDGSIGSKVIFIIERLNTLTMQYEDFFTGEIDLSTFSNGVLYNGISRAVAATVIEGGIGAMLDAAGSTAYFIPIDPNDCEYAFMDGMLLRGTYNYIALAAGTTSFLNYKMYTPVVYKTTVDGTYPVATSHNQTGSFTTNYTNGDLSGTALPNTPFAAYDNYLFTSQQQMDVTINVYHPNFYYSNTSGQDIVLRIDALIVSGLAQYPFAFSRQTIFQDPHVVSAGTNYNIPGGINASSAQFSLNPGDRVYLVYYPLVVGGSGAPSGDFNYGEGAVHISSVFRNTGTICACYRLGVLIDKFLAKVTGQSGLLESTYLNAPNARWHYLNPYNVRLTCGDALRNLTTNAAGDKNVTPSIRISWRDIQTYLRYAHGCGIDFRNGKVVVERMEYFFDQNSIIADVGQVASLVDGPATEYMASAGKWGYPVQSYDKLNGKDEPNTTITWKYPIDKVPTPQDCTVNIRTDCYGIEEARANLSNKKTTDDASDNDTFAFETESFTSTVSVNPPGAPAINYTNVYQLYRPQNSVTQPAATGFISPETIFNLTMMPYLNLKRCGRIENSMFRNLQNKVLTVQPDKGTKNTQITINLGNGVINATGDILVSELDPPIHNCHLFHAEIVLKNTYLSAMNNKPSGCIRFYEGPKVYKGFPMEVSVKSADDNSYNGTFLATADTDLSQKIE